MLRRFGQDVEQLLAVAFSLGLADAGNLEQVFRCLRAMRREFEQRAVMQNDVSRTFFLLRDIVKSSKARLGVKHQHA